MRLVRVWDPVRNLTLRNLFLDHTLRIARAEPDAYPNLFLPGTMLILCAISEVVLWLKGPASLPLPPQGAAPDETQFRWRNDDIFTDLAEAQDSISDIRAGLAQGAFGLLLVRVDPEAWDHVDRPELSCMGGEIYLESLTPVDRALERLYESLRLVRPDQQSPLVPHQVSVHASGLSIYGKTTLPWEPGKEFAAPFQLARVIESGEETTDFRLTVELERLQKGERSALIEATQDLNAAISPADPITARSPETAAPRWVTLAVSQPRDILRFTRIFDFQERCDIPDRVGATRTHD